MSDSARISPTAGYTGSVWVRAGLSPRELVPFRGRALHALVSPLARGAAAAGLPSLDDLLLARHLLLDRLAGDAVASGEVAQVVEIAAGLSGRGMRMTARHPGLRWVEADLPGMATTKRARLARCAPASARVEVVDLDVLARGALAALDLDHDAGTAVITEGLLNYLPAAAVRAVWEAVAAFLGRFPRGIYLAEVHTRVEVPDSPAERLFRFALGTFARGRVEVHHRDPAEAEAELRRAGLEPRSWHLGTEAHPHPSAAMVRVVVAEPSGGPRAGR